MLPEKLYGPLRHLALVGFATAFPLLYVASVTLESTEVAVLALAVAGVSAVLAALAY
jgi:hypothetical protein